MLMQALVCLIQLHLVFLAIYNWTGGCVLAILPVLYDIVMLLEFWFSFFQIV